jgi:hypothetical protein
VKKCVCVIVFVIPRRRLEHVTVYYESIKRERKRRLMYEYRCDERLKTKTEEFTRLTDTGLVQLEHLKIKTRLMDDKFASVTVRGECEQGNSLCFYCVFNVGVV